MELGFVIPGLKSLTLSLITYFSIQIRLCTQMTQLLRMCQMVIWLPQHFKILISYGLDPNECLKLAEVFYELRQSSCLNLAGLPPEPSKNVAPKQEEQSLLFDYTSLGGTIVKLKLRWVLIDKHVQETALVTWLTPLIRIRCFVKWKHSLYMHW